MNYAKPPKIAGGWNECSMEQLRHLHELIGEYSDNRPVRNLYAWLYLADLAFVEGEGEIGDNGEIRYWLKTLSNSPLKGEDTATKEEMEGITAEIERLSRELQRFRAQLLSHLLIPAGKGAEYKSEDAEELAGWMLPHMDKFDWLVDILIQHLQSCICVYRTQFPDLFSGSSEDISDLIPLVGEINTVNAVMKWQGYQEQQKVYDSNAIFIFGILNSMTKEAKAIEEASKKMQERLHRF